MKHLIVVISLFFSSTLVGQIVPVTNLSSGSTYITIGDAVNDANAGDTLQLAATTFNERVTLSQPLTLLGNPD